MPYKDKDQQRAYMREWMAKRRAAWFADKVCARCGSTENLQNHHRDKTKKISHNVWSWSDKRRQAELTKCDVLCRHCHDKETVKQGARTPPTHGTMGRYVFGGCRCDLCCARRQAYWRYEHLRRRLRRRGIDPDTCLSQIRAQAGYPVEPPVTRIEGLATNGTDDVEDGSIRGRSKLAPGLPT